MGVNKTVTRRSLGYSRLQLGDTHDPENLSLFKKQWLAEADSYAQIQSLSKLSRRATSA
jgi:hypothetical protein